LPVSNGPAGVVAVSDLLCRSESGSRWAYTGMIFGSEVRCAYLAMCSMFLARDDVWLFNTYPPAEPTYGMEDAAAKLRERQYAVRVTQGDDAGAKPWQRMLPGGIGTDAFFMNSRGNGDFFELVKGTAFPDDVPMLNRPTILHLIHSWSMQNPNMIGSVGGRWLEHGSYAAVGSCWEPYLAAFVPPSLLAERLRNYIPFLVAARWWDDEGAFCKVWRVQTFGDP
jgi:hypothetical protein